MPRKEPETVPSTPTESDYITPPQNGLLLTLAYALPRVSDLLRRCTDIKSSGLSKPLNMNPATALWLLLALVGVVISANSYAVGLQHWLPDAQGQLTTLIPLGREDVLFRPMAIFPPVLQWFSHLVNLGLDLAGALTPDIPGFSGTPYWQPEVRPTIWSNATLALAWWVGLIGSVIVSATQGLFTRRATYSKQREYAQRLNKLARIALNPKAISVAKREVNKANRYGQGAIWGICLIACAGWGWELFVADGALTGTTFPADARWIYGLSSTFLAELAWFIAGFCDQKYQ